MTETRFRDRTDAGERLVAKLAPLTLADPVVQALPRGGVPVALPVARALNAPLDLIMVRKLGVPGHEELAAGAVVDGAAPQTVFNDAILRGLGLSAADFTDAIARRLDEIAHRRAAYLGDRAPVPVAGRDVVVVDDGIATGATVRAALKALAAMAPDSVTLAVPVAPPDTLRELAPLVDRIVCLHSPADFRAVGLHYVTFGQSTDQEVAACLAAARQEDPA